MLRNEQRFVRRASWRDRYDVSMPPLANTPLRDQPGWGSGAETWQDEIRWIFANPGSVKLGNEGFTQKNFPEIARLLRIDSDRYLRRALWEHARDARPRGVEDELKERALRGAACAFFYLDELEISRNEYAAYQNRPRPDGKRPYGLETARARLSWARDVQSAILAPTQSLVLPTFRPHPHTERTARMYQERYADAFVRLIVQLANDDYGDEFLPDSEPGPGGMVTIGLESAQQRSDRDAPGGLGSESRELDRVKRLAAGDFSARPRTEEQGTGGARGSRALRSRRPRSKLWLAGAIGVFGFATAAFSMLSGPPSGLVAASAPSPVELDSVEVSEPIWGTNTVFWVPASSPLEELDDVVNGCDDPSARAWLWKYGSYRHPYLFTVRNLSDDTVGISNVVSHGEASAPKPGVLVSCSDGGQGGGLEWSAVEIDLADGAVAQLADESSVSTYFWRDIDAGEKAGVVVYTDSQQDFKGTLTIEASPVAGDPSELQIPEAGGEPLDIDYHAVPSDRRVALTLWREGYEDPMTCRVNGERLEPCTGASIRSAIDALWADDGE